MKSLAFSLCLSALSPRLLQLIIHIVVAELVAEESRRCRFRYIIYLYARSRERLRDVIDLTPLQDFRWSILTVLLAFCNQVLLTQQQSYVLRIIFTTRFQPLVVGVRVLVLPSAFIFDLTRSQANGGSLVYRTVKALQLLHLSLVLGLPLLNLV